MDSRKCRVCGEYSVTKILNFFDQPIVHNLEEAKGASYLKYPFILGHCKDCNFVCLTKPIEPEILYDNYFTVSAWKNQPHVSRLIDLIKQVSNGNLDQKILEIGCNDGSFIQALKDSGFKDILGVEPTKDSYDLALAKNLDVEHNFFPHENLSHDTYDLVISRHVLEHILDLQDFLSGIKLCIKSTGILVVEIPDSEILFEKLDYALWEEHVNYFTLNTLSFLLNKHGFEVVHFEKTLFSGASLTVFAQKVTYKIKPLPNSLELMRIEKYKDKFPVFKNMLHDFLNSREEVIIYGCGARSSNFVNLLGLNMITKFVDDQPEKQYKFVPGYDIQVLPWSSKFANKYFLLGVNTENESKLLKKRNLNIANFASILPPSKNLPGFWRELINC
jgi:SAM-dependent methyltransferase